MEGIVGDPSDHSSVVGDEVGQVRPAASGGEPRRRDESPLTVFLVCASPAGRFLDFVGEAPPALLQMLEKDELVLVGAALALGWHLSSRDSAPTDAAHAHMRASSTRQCRGARAVLGFIDYPIVQATALAEPVAVGGPADALTCCRRFGPRLVVTTRPGSAQPAAEERLAEVLERWSMETDSRSRRVVILLAPSIAVSVVNGRSACLHTAAITQRVARQRDLLIPSEPPGNSPSAVPPGRPGCAERAE